MKRKTITEIRLVFGSTGPTSFEPQTGIRDAGGKYFNLIYLILNSDGLDHNVTFLLGHGRPHLQPIPGIKQRLINFTKSALVTEISEGQRSVTVSFKLMSGKSFCETAINVGFDLMTCLAVKDEEAKKIIYNFRLDQRHEVKYGKNWLSYEDYLLETHPLLSPFAYIYRK